jgi:hypothetical protein
MKKVKDIVAEEMARKILEEFPPGFGNDEGKEVLVNYAETYLRLCEDEEDGDGGVAPIYDEVFFQGVAALDAEDGDGPPDPMSSDD